MEKFGLFKLLSSLQKDGGDKTDVLSALLKTLANKSENASSPEKPAAKEEKNKENGQNVKLSTKENNPLIFAITSHDDFINKVYKKNSGK